eukprot:34303_1
MLCLTLIIFQIITLSHADHEVCDTCTQDTDCDSDIAGIEGCISFGDEKICYWKDPNIVIIDDGTGPSDDFPDSRECVDDNHCYSRLLESNDFISWKNYNEGCMRCCPNTNINKNLCTATIGNHGGETCGNVAEAFFGTIAPCCTGQYCLDNVYGICTVEASECDSCMILTEYVVGSVVKKDNCVEGLMCLKDDETPDINHIHENSENDDSNVIISRGICVSENGISQTVTTECSNNEDCPRCMRCCANSEGIKQCVRSSGDSCGLLFEGRGPCCCPQDICKLNECLTSAPSISPS